MPRFAVRPKVDFMVMYEGGGGPGFHPLLLVTAAILLPFAILAAASYTSLGWKSCLPFAIDS
jgi:hypothetical protein